MNVHSVSLAQDPDAMSRAWCAVCSCGWRGLTWNYIGSARNEGDKHQREHNREEP